MSRPQVLVRPLEKAHHRDLVDMWVESRVEVGASSEGALRATSGTALSSVLRRPDVTSFLALVDDDPVGYLVLSDTVAGMLTESPCTAIDQLYVKQAWRRHGVARQLLAAAAGHADRVGADAIISHVPSQVRDANRFFARLGFTPTVVRRVTTPAALHRKLAAAGEARTGLEQVLQRRRSARFRAVRQRAAAEPADA